MKRTRKFESPIKLIIYTITIILCFIYLIYRIFFTIPFKYGWISIILGIFILMLEIVEFIEFLVYYVNILCYDKETPKIPTIKKSKYPEVDVFIATINESEDLLDNTIKACLRLKYPNKKKVHIYICDDGNRANIKKLASKYKIGYITRDDNKGAKAGNYNNALKKSFSPYIVTLDADMQPTPEFLLRTMSFFIKEEKVGFVQLPQSFVNPDIFQLRFGLSKEIPFEQDYFYHRIQLAKNKTNSTIYCGTNAVLSREALEEINGFALNTITEDIATGMLIEAKGYKGIALSYVEAYGNAVNDLEAFFKQRSRWARGCIQILKNYKIVNNQGLTMCQKLDYLAAISYWFYGVRRILYLIMPLLFSLFGIMIIDCNLIVFVVIFFSQYLMKRVILDVLEDYRKSSTWNNIYEIILAPIMAKEVLKELFGFGSTKFEVTPKGDYSKKMSKTNKNLLVIHSLFLLFSILGLVLAIYKSTLLSIYRYIIPILWLTMNIIYLLIAIVFDLKVKAVCTDNFVPNLVKQYRKKSYIKLLINCFKRNKTKSGVKV